MGRGGWTANPDASQAVIIEGLDTFVGGMAEVLEGVHSCHRRHVPEITIKGPGIAKGVCGLRDLVKSQDGVLYGEAGARWRRRR